MVRSLFTLWQWSIRDRGYRFSTTIYGRRSLPQVIGIGEAPGVLPTIPLKDYYELVGVVGVAQDPSSLGAASLSGSSMVVVEYRLPALVVLYFMAHKQVRHDVVLPF